MHRVACSACLLMTLLGSPFAGSLLAQGEREETPPPAPQAPRDPTVPSGELRLLLNPPTDAPAPAGAPAPLAPLPPIAVRAKMIGPGKQASALLTLSGATGGGAERFYLVRPGQSYHILGGEGRTLHVLEVAREGVVIELLPDRRQLVLP